MKTTMYGEAQAAKQVDVDDENPPKKSCQVRRCLVLFFGCLFIAALAIFTVLYVKLENDYGTLRKKFDATAKNERLKRINYARTMRELTDKKLNNSEHTLRRYTRLLVKNFTAYELRWFRDEMSGKVHGIDPRLKTSLEKFKKAVDSLIPVVENLRLNFTRLANSSDSRMRRFGHLIDELKNHLVLARKDLTLHPDNASLHTKLEEAFESAASSTEKVRRELSTFRNSTASKIGQMMTDVNNTNVNIANVLKMLSRQNASLHSKIRDTFAALSSKVDDANRKIVDLRNLAATELQRLREDLNDTRESLRRTHNEFANSNRSIYTQFQRVAKSQSASVKSMSEGMRSLRKDVENNKNIGVTQQKITSEKISRMKVEFQESLKKTKEATSGSEKKMMIKQEGLEEQQHSQQNEISELRRKVNDLQNMVKQAKNKASGRLCVNIQLIFITCLFGLCFRFSFN